MFHEKIKELRKQKGYTGEFVATSVGISESAYRNYERGVREPNFETLSKLAQFYEVTTDSLLGLKPLPDPFADLKLSEEDEKEVIDKYMSLPDDVRACMLDVLIKLGDAAKSRREKIVDVPETVSNDKTAENDLPYVDCYTGELEDQWEEEQNAKKDAG